MVAEYSDRTVGSVVAEKGVNLYLNEESWKHKSKQTKEKRSRTGKKVPVPISQLSTKLARFLFLGDLVHTFVGDCYMRTKM